MASETCETCRFRSDGPHYNSDRGTAEFHDIMFACKRRAPVVTGGMMSNTMTIWPMIGMADWCGEYRPTHQPSPQCEHGIAEMDCDDCVPF